MPILKGEYMEKERTFVMIKPDAVQRRLTGEIISRFEKKGIKTSIFKSYLPHQFILCLWTSKRRKKLLESAKKFEALVVLGCEGAVQTVRDSVKSAACKVFQGMKSEGVMSLKPRFHLPGNISLELDSVCQIIHQTQQSETGDNP